MFRHLIMAIYISYFLEHNGNDEPHDYKCQMLHRLPCPLHHGYVGIGHTGCANCLLAVKHIPIAVYTGLDS